ncbi:hypothetical protein DFP72DRAFT_911360 [Ephemerocybe angulata]|uniref:Uncharacterized protein n=1 Tax=Ephemerocybe angulata TaxID=980116 RepID=A0A8H6HP62_9AGAR|nr:hypothetical protein DFP72DRAFT_911360 [Tulosesus angulatus]
MRLILGPVLSLVLLIASFGLLANAYVDHDEFIARFAVDGLSTRGESLAVPFQHSLREFLEEAADVYQRSLDEYEGGILEARTPRTVTMYVLFMKDGIRHYKVRPLEVSSDKRLSELVPLVIGALPAELQMPAEDFAFSVSTKPAGLPAPDKEMFKLLKMDKTIDDLFPNSPSVTIQGRRKSAKKPESSQPQRRT